jgi:AhpD family alkylhydroperoxidase
VTTIDFRERRRSIARTMKTMRGSIPATMRGFDDLHRAAVADGALSLKHKELMALAIGIATRCEGCIAFHVRDALEAGASRPEIEEAIGVAIMMGGGPGVMYAADAFDALEQYETAAAQ